MINIFSSMRHSVLGNASLERCRKILVDSINSRNGILPGADIKDTINSPFNKSSGVRYASQAREQFLFVGGYKTEGNFSCHVPIRERFTYSSDGAPRRSISPVPTAKSLSDWPGIPHE